MVNYLSCPFLLLLLPLPLLLVLFPLVPFAHILPVVLFFILLTNTDTSASSSNPCQSHVCTDCDTLLQGLGLGKAVSPQAAVLQPGQQLLTSSTAAT